MDPKLKEAAFLGNIAFLLKAIDSEPPEYFQSQFTPLDGSDVAGNIFHLAAWRGKEKFFREARKRLPIELQEVLLAQQDKDSWNPLHVAAKRSKKNPEFVKLILDFYKSSLPSHDDITKPWLTLNKASRTPFHMAIRKGTEEVALEILSMDIELLVGMVDKEENSPLFLAIEKGFNRLAEEILMSSCSYSVSGPNGSTPLHFAPKCSEKVLKLLLQDHPELIDVVDNEGFTVLHKWAEIAEAWPFNLLLGEDFPAARKLLFRKLINITDNENGQTPLHVAAMTGNYEVGQALVGGYQQEIGAGGMPQSLGCDPWKAKTKLGDTPLHLAMYKGQDLALYFLSLDATLCQTHNNKGESPLFLAVSAGFAEVVNEILTTQDPRFSMLRRSDGLTVLHSLPFCPETTAKRLLEKFWWIINLPDDNGKTALDKAKEADLPWLVKLLMNPSLINKEPFDWVTACEREETSAVLAFIDNCHDLQKLCREQDDTPLHHIKLRTYKDYLDFLKIPSIMELKNATDLDGATPLHRALERRDMLLAKALLTENGVDRNIEDCSGTTAANLLARLCKENADWEKMCKQINVSPYLKTSYIQPGTNLEQMRNTLSVVAALLATITFAAGFTLPGGLKSDIGYAILAKQPSFLVFLLADGYAMCTSMLVLFCLIWSMISEPDMTSLLVDRSVLILLQSLYGTMVAFMTGIYTVMGQRSLWAAIIIIIMCCFIVILANKAILRFVIAKLIPPANQDQSDRIHLIP